MVFERIFRTLLASSLALSLSLQAVPSLAEPTAADKETARTLMDDADKKTAAGDLREALRLYKAADDLMGVPTTGLEVARAQIKLGLLVEANEILFKVTRIAVTPKEPAAFAKARAAAEQLSSELQGRIPSVKVKVEGLASGVVAQVTIDGEALPAAAVGFPRKVNPGLRRVIASAKGHESASIEVTLAEKESREVSLTLKALAVEPPPAASSAAVPPPPASTATAAPPPPTTAAAPPPPPPTAPPAGPRKPVMVYGGFGLGLLGVAVGGIGGLVAISKASSVKSKCDGERCPELVRSDIVSTKNWALVSDIGFAVGVVGAGVGLVALIAGGGSASSSAKKTSIEPVVGLNNLGLRGQILKNFPLLLALLAPLGCERVVGVEDLKIVHAPDAGVDDAGDASTDAAKCTASDPGDCGSCIEKICCDPALACSAVGDCKKCLSSPTAAGCDDSNAALKKYADCARDKCPVCATP